MGLYLVLLLGGPAFMWMILGVSTNMTCLKKYHLGKTYRQCAQQWNQNHCFIMGAINQWDTICKAYSSNHNQVASKRACAQDDSVQQLLDSACVPGGRKRHRLVDPLDSHIQEEQGTPIHSRPPRVKRRAAAKAASRPVASIKLWWRLYATSMRIEQYQNYSITYFFRGENLSSYLVGPIRSQPGVQLLSQQECVQATTFIHTMFSSQNWNNYESKCHPWPTTPNQTPWPRQPFDGTQHRSPRETGRLHRPQAQNLSWHRPNANTMISTQQSRIFETSPKIFYF